ncbi:MAG TPA: 1,4-dihydroxy-6-naphthoate synthase [Segetibacter sp.]|nr:1,4-dihydroxy-6-naphthoate synthase [Segetibacter sp.]
MQLTLGFSPCPNDTFIFDALVNKKIDAEGVDFEVVLEDVQTLNTWALEGRLDVSKISYGVLPLIIDKYVMLNSGGALGQGVGPLLIAKNEIKDLSIVDHFSIAVPGVNTTANMLFSFAFPNAKNKKFFVFDKIMDAVLNEEVDAGVIIHESRFTYKDRGLINLMDLGDYWEQQTSAPIPLGGIIIKRSFDAAVQQKLQRLIKRSIEYSLKNYPEISSYVSSHSQELSEDVMRKHIDLYVNDFSIDLKDKGRDAVQKFLEVYANSNAAKAIHTNDIFVAA